MNNKYLILLSFCFVLTGINAQNSVLNYLTAMEKRLTEEEKKMLQMIYEPVVVGIPPTDARADVCIRLAHGCGMSAGGYHFRCCDVFHDGRQKRKAHAGISGSAGYDEQGRYRICARYPGR